MILPLGPVGAQDEPPPSIIKEEYSKYWWALLALYVSVTVGRVVATDVFGALISGIVAFVAWYMVKDGCARMSQYCVLMFGMVCVMEALFEFVALAGSLPGRRTEHTTRMPNSESKVTYTTVVETHSFFDPTQGWHYNFQSGMKIVNVLSLIAGASLSWVTYSLYPSSLFDSEREAGMSMYGSGLGSTQGGNNYQAYGTSTNSRLVGGGGGGGGGQRLGRDEGRGIFEGQGQRLGSG